jgi:protein-S-isoprenylcysteine O-methyltransferase Ste14
VALTVLHARHILVYQIVVKTLTGSFSIALLLLTPLTSNGRGSDAALTSGGILHHDQPAPGLLWCTRHSDDESVDMEIGILKLTLFIAISGWLLYISRKSLRVLRSHGFYRFFAWEAILALVLVNSGTWFSDPLSALHIVSWVLLMVSLLMLAQGLSLILRIGKPYSHREDESLLPFERTSVLIMVGLYRYIRHPLNGSLLFLAWGAFLKQTVWYSWCLVGVATVFLIATAKADEAECIRHFGPSYHEYMSGTKMFIPYLF